ncbi:tyrosine-type recombinase/integrase [Uliginosibacterium sp. 31-16]|uniref:tyrosine-type recombinase/integrase n=1 Tax=Uliginosibacterium sp. 31-16 TaxID=3068315 RepID=UPI00273D2B4C|nr:tyrosine-type recombinase/integrase [Uliginosibacterium sp. 31-16]MDP5239907.1 tyrosine-type recombinase/integrase [Uliginosibacterium sp. 31-16]
MFKKGYDSNRNNKHDLSTVEPIRELSAIAAIKALVADSPREFALFVIGINTAFRASDLLRLKVGQVRGLQVGDDMLSRERKTGKSRRITANQSVVDAVAKLLATMPDAEDHDFLFQSTRWADWTKSIEAGKRIKDHLSVTFLARLIKEWCAAVGLTGNYGTHTLRKTCSYHAYKTFGVPLETIMEMLNHSSPKTTLGYLCIQDEEVRAAYLNTL